MLAKSIMKISIALFIAAVMLMQPIQVLAQAPAPPAPEPAAQPPAGVPAPTYWGSDYNAALAKAKEGQAPIVVMFYSLLVPPCNSMNREILPRPNIREFLRPFVLVALDTDNNKDLAKQYKITALPAFIILDPLGREYDRFTGFLPPEAFIATMKAAIDPRNSPGVLLRKAKADPNDLESRWQLAQKYARDRKPKELNALLAEMRGLDPDGAKGYLDRVSYMELMTGLDVQNPKDGIASSEEFLKNFPKSKYVDQVDMTRAQLYYQAGDTEKALQILKAFPTTHPNSPLAKQVTQGISTIERDIHQAPPTPPPSAEQGAGDAPEGGTGDSGGEPPAQ